MIDTGEYIPLFVIPDVIRDSVPYCYSHRNRCHPGPIEGWERYGCMAHLDKKSCGVGDREILHCEFALLFDRCVICNDGRIIENNENVYGGIAGTGTWGVWDEDTFF